MRSAPSKMCLHLGTLLFTCFYSASGSADANFELDEKLIPVVAQCANCHGANGIATLPTAANLAGQNPVYTEIQLKNYRDGKRQDAVMNVAVQNLSNQDIVALAKYYSQLTVD